jgi:hypothetical protein
MLIVLLCPELNQPALRAQQQSGVYGNDAIAASSDDEFLASCCGLSPDRSMSVKPSLEKK